MYSCSFSDSDDSQDESSCDGISFISEITQESSSTRNIVLHMDVDYFYAQCEELELEESERQRPIAVGQKHIIVTCNYIAREFGVKKLELQTEARKKCPCLLIIDGSDLERYRKFSTQIYKVLRETIHSMAKEYRIGERDVAMKKGGMDEVACDVTALVDAIVESDKGGGLKPLPPNAFVYGNEASSVVLREDQSGAASTIVANQSYDYHSESMFSNNPLHHDNDLVEKRLHIAAACAEQVRQAIHKQLGFTTSLGVSTSPMLSKIASSIQKPNGLSILYPWRSCTLISEMPLRSVPQLGSRTLKALVPCLDRYNIGKQTSKNDFWKCRDLLQVPRHKVLACLQTLNTSKQASEALCDDLMNKCRGVDHTRIEDDGGGLAKTVSVENTFRRNTARTSEAVWNALQELTMRLPRLLLERRTNSSTPSLSYPTILRLTAAVVDKSIQKRRPFVTRSKQCSFPSGKALMEETEETSQSEILLKAATPLVKNLLLKNTSDINLVRLNIAVTGFQDLESTSSPSTSTTTSPWAAFATKTSQRDQSNKRQRTEPNMKKVSVVPAASQKVSSRSICFAKSSATDSKLTSTTSKASTNLEPNSLKVDPLVLAELPPDIQEEILRTYNTKPPAKRTIDDFFVKK